MNLNRMLEGSKLAQIRSTVKRVFFYRICGTGMGACACLATEMGLEVEGCDLSFSPPMSDYLESSKIQLMHIDDVTHEYLKDFDLIVVGNSVPRDSKYAKFIEENPVSFCSFPSFLGEFVLKDREVIGVSGTHGKTTTTYFGKQILDFLGEDTGYFIGGILDGMPPARLGSSKYFIIESDEYDSAYFQKISKHRLYEIDHLIITSLEFDHADIFNSMEDIKDEFRATLKKLNGKVVGNDEYLAINELQNEFSGKDWKRYGINTDNFKIVEKSENGVSFSVGDNLIKTNILGLHNILNINSLFNLFKELGHDVSKLKMAIENLSLVRRRQEVRGTFQDAIVIDDFAHHPRAVSYTIDSIKDRFPKHKIITVFEPISATARSDRFQLEFTDALESSDEVIIAENEILRTGKQQLNCSQMVKDLNSRGISSVKCQQLNELMDQIKNKSDKNSVLLVLSNRTCLGLWESDFVKKLSK